MAIFDVPIIRIEVAEAINSHWEGEHGLGPKMARPDVQPKILKIAASNALEAANLVQRLYPGWIADRSNIMKAKSA